MRSEILQMSHCSHPLGLCQAVIDCGSKTVKGGEWSRRNGWSLPLHPLQLVAWFFLSYFLLMYFAVLVPSCPNGAWQIGLSVVNAVIALVHLTSHAFSITIDPADCNVRAKNVQGPLPPFDRNKHAHVIENQFCYICEVKVGNRSKHCSTCNKCIEKFDHHCKWLNNCVGSRNYRYFAGCVASALTACLLTFFLSTGLIVAYFTKSSWLHQPPRGVFRVFVPVDKTVWLLMVEVCAALSLLAIALLSHLLGFHLFLAFKGLSTYDYIMLKRSALFHGAAADGTKNIFLKWCKSKAISPAQNQNKAAVTRRNEMLELNGSNANKADPENGTRKDERASNALRPGEVYVNSPFHQRYVLKELQKPKVKVDHRARASRATEVCDHGSRAPVVGIAQPGTTAQPSDVVSIQETKLDARSVDLTGVAQPCRSVSQTSLETGGGANTEAEAPGQSLSPGSAARGSLSNLLFSEGAALTVPILAEPPVDSECAPSERRPVDLEALPRLRGSSLPPITRGANDGQATGNVFAVSASVLPARDDGLRRWAVKRTSIVHDEVP
ncbi:unnamed protein product [Ixodes hexagonus]